MLQLCIIMYILLLTSTSLREFNALLIFCISMCLELSVLCLFTSFVDVGFRLLEFTLQDDDFINTTFFTLQEVYNKT